MSRAILAITALATLMVTGPALAFQCPKLVAKVHDEAYSRFDDASYDARAKADEAEALHKAGKHAEAEKAAKEGLARLGLNCAQRVERRAPANSGARRASVRTSRVPHRRGRTA